ncbi:hypothetical protein RRG08_066393 [Elysia crispata]|uniref:Uncharacterized protein n=1 Tax=Elysia crispata TaxID=231223 RepID=A0AAE0YSM2_9GAST|nr:hypothetical protein RRG08_066393 [Elysia crispata]
MRNIGKVLKTSHIGNKAFKQELYSFLRNYRQTPHSTTGQPPSLLMFGRQTRSKLPTTSTTPSHNQQTLYDLSKLTGSFQKQKMKNYADNKNSKPSNINIACGWWEPIDWREKLAKPVDGGNLLSGETNCVKNSDGGNLLTGAKNWPSLWMVGTYRLARKTGQACGWWEPIEWRDELRQA